MNPNASELIDGYGGAGGWPQAQDGNQYYDLSDSSIDQVFSVTTPLSLEFSWWDNSFNSPSPSDWEFFTAHWDDFCYPFDEVVIAPDSARWLLFYHHDERFYFGNRNG